MKSYFLFFLLFFSCTIVRVIDHKEANKSLEQSRRKLVDFQSKLVKDLSEKKLFLNEVKRYFDSIEYKDLIYHLKEIIILEEKNLINIDESLKKHSSIPRPQKIIKSTEKEYNLFIDKNEDFKSSLAIVDSINKKIQNINNKLQAIVNDKKIFKINPIELKSKIDENKEKTVKQISQVESQLKFYQQKFNQNKDVMIKLNNINKILDKIKIKRNELFAYLEKLNQIIIDQKHYWVAPGIFGHNYTYDIEALVNELKSLASEYNLKVIELNKN